MRKLAVSIFIVLIFILYIGLSTQASANPEQAAQAFINAIRQGNEQKLAQALQEERWKVLTNNGQNKLLFYTASEPQLAFLAGTPFQVQEITKRPPERWPMCLIPISCTESAFHEYRLSFAPSQPGPYFLPKQLAFGAYYNLEMSKLEAFAKDPSQDYRQGFTMRLRRSIQPNALQVQPGPAMYGLLPKARNVVPVVDASGKEVPIELVAAKLPRLKSIVLQVQLIREGRFAPWKVSLYDFKEAVIVSQGKEFQLRLMSNFSN